MTHISSFWKILDFDSYSFPGFQTIRESTNLNNNMMECSLVYHPSIHNKTIKLLRVYEYFPTRLSSLQILVCCPRNFLARNRVFRSKNRATSSTKFQNSPWHLIGFGHSYPIGNHRELTTVSDGYSWQIVGIVIILTVYQVEMRTKCRSLRISPTAK